MDQKQLDLLITRLVKQPMKYGGVEPQIIKEKNDRDFCNSFFHQSNIDILRIEHMLTASIKCQNDYELDLLLMLVEHFQVVSFFALILAPLLIQPWHNWHDRIARLLMNEKNPDIVSFLFRGATYYCKNLDYQSDYKEFNRKCMYGLRNIGTIEAVSCLNELCKHEDKSISALAKKFL